MHQKIFCGLVFLVCSLSRTYSLCPSSLLISPCSCSLKDGQLPSMACNDISSLKSLSDIFSAKFPTNELNEIVISDSQLGPLPNDVFRGKSFRTVYFSMNRHTSFKNKNIFSSSQQQLTNLTIIQETDSWTFDFENVAGLSKLSYLKLIGDDVRFTGTMKSPTLEALTLVSYSLKEFPKLGDLPSLQTLDLDANAIAAVPANAFASMPKLTNLYLGHNKLVSLGSSALVFTSAMTTVDLSGNLISTLQVGWISGDT